MPADAAPQPEIDDTTPRAERRKDPAQSLDEVLVAHEELKAAKWRAKVKVWGPIVLGILGVGGYGGYQYLPTPGDVQEDIQKLEEKAEENTRKIRALGKVTIEGLNHLGTKIDAVHPEVEPIEKPPSLVEAEKVVEEQKTEAKLDEILKGAGG